ncbi:uncharacterized protein BO87DRAFT_458505, partial [Aspergillus neoniger CBS 115656]
LFTLSLKPVSLTINVASAQSHTLPSSHQQHSLTHSPFLSLFTTQQRKTNKTTLLRPITYLSVTINQSNSSLKR